MPETCHIPLQFATLPLLRSTRGKRLVLTALGALCLFSSRDATAQVFSPGKLSRAHAAFEAKCESCHVKAEAGKVKASRCLACHRVLGVRIKARKGLHGRERLLKCAKCHSEHLGRGHALVKWNQRSFNHIRAGYSLTGKHAALACRKCHQPSKQRGAVTRLFGAGQRKRTFLGLRKGCATCHQDPHRGTLGTACASCHGDQGFKPVTRFTAHHRTRFPLRGKHRKLGCDRCHRPAGPSSPMQFAGVLHDTCTRCHKSPHRRHMGQKRSPKIPCASCHGEDSFRRISFAKTSHPRTLPLRGGHARAPCKSCHGKKGERATRGTRCVSCHRDPHKKRFGLACQKCHTPFGWWTRRGKLMSLGQVKLDQVKRAATIGIGKKQVQAVAFHNKTRFTLDGQHIALACKKCHGRRGRGRWRFRKLRNMKFGRCEDCHKDPHQGVLTQRRSGSKRRCEDCHETRGWALTSFGLERHQKTRFPLQGAHRVVACAACHPRKTRSAKRRFQPPSSRCESCHKDKHRGRYRLTASSAALPCQTCHQTQSFRQIAFDHQKTRFPLQGKHAQTACRSCHRPAKQGITAFRGLDQRCESCHADTRHGGQFLARGKVRGCADCHSTTSFKIERFAHLAKTGVSLAGGHRRVKCDGCHIKVTSPAPQGPRQVVLYRLGKAGCQSCHATYHKTVGQRAWKRLAPHARGALLQETLGTKPAATRLDRCADCHRVRSWRSIKKKVPRFDHVRVGYALRGRHALATCNRCHTPKRRRISRRCASCHRDAHAGKLGTRCAECHDSRTWRPSALLARHRRTRLPLTGFHALADCASCHPRNAKPLFRGAPAACVACHANRYNDPKTHPNHRTAGFDQRCERCHRPTGWRGARFASQSAALTAHRRLPLTGGHAKLACTSCHGRKRPRPDCASCHYRRARRVRQPDHRFAPLDRRCARCHGTSSWKKARLATKHPGFPLNGKHGQLTCNDCHREGNGFLAFSCTGACHDPRKLRPSHRRVRGFVGESRACKRCHPLGRR